MSVENILAGLRKVKKVGRGKYMACCPAHNDNSPSLSIKDENGTVLLHCFGEGCGAMEILGALGLEPSEMFPPDNHWKPDEHGVVHQSKFTAMDALRCLQNEGAVMALLAADQAEGKCLDASERDRLAVCCGRIAAALNYLESN